MYVRSPALSLLLIFGDLVCAESPFNGLQACKAVSLQVIEDISGPISSRRGQYQDAVCRHPFLWSPGPPVEAGGLQLRFAESPQPTQHFAVYQLMPFGGENGSRLNSLCRVTALMDGRTGFHGFAFAYNNGFEDLYGRRRVFEHNGWSRYCVEQSCVINGRAGEFITGLEVSVRSCTVPTRRLVQSIQVSCLS
jgi:hypothetical protein